MKRISKVNWSWDYGKVRSELTYTDGETEVRTNEEKPPTGPCHDIAHFICGFHKHYEWDYEGEYYSAKVAEYNAVFLENILYFYLKNRNLKWPMYMIAHSIEEHMNWFVNIHYKMEIPGDKLKKWFLKRLDIPLIINHYPSYHQVQMMENESPDDVRDIKVSITMDESLDHEDQDLYDYLVEMRDILGD
jgi:hypothetical protein